MLAAIFDSSPTGELSSPSAVHSCNLLCLKMAECFLHGCEVIWTGPSPVFKTPKILEANNPT